MEARYGAKPFHDTSGGELEPSLGSTASVDQTKWSAGKTDDREGDEHDGREPDHDDEEDPAENGIGDADGLLGDREPSLGSLEQISQLRWASGDREDHELALEPSLTTIEAARKCGRKQSNCIAFADGRWYDASTRRAVT